jgi:peptidyl-prolyl cis-trans isomerase C
MKLRLIIPCLALVVLASCTSTDDSVVAQVGDYEITVAKIKDEYLAISPHARPRLDTIEEKEAFAKDVVAKEVIRLEAEKAGFGDIPEALEAREATVQNKAWQAYYEGEIKGKITITEDDMRALYDQQEVAYHMAWIFTRSGGMAGEALRKIRSGRPFGEIAGIYSIDPSRSRGGDIGFRPLGTMPANVEAAVEAMSPGDMSDVLAYDDYYTIIQIVEKQEREQMDYEGAKVGLESMLMTKKITERQKTLAAGYREKYHVTYNDDALELVAARTREANPRESGPVGQLPRFSQEELATVIGSRDGEEWTIGRYLERIATVRDFGRPSYGADAEFIRSIMRDYMTGELWILEALELGYGEREDVVRAADREYEKAVITAFHDSLVEDVVVDPEMLRGFYEENREQLVSEPTYNLAIIVLETRPEAEEVYEALMGGADFGALAASRSIDIRTKDQGGEIRETFVGSALQQFPDIHDAVYEMKEGDIAGPMLLPPTWGPEGYIVLKLVMKGEPRQLEFEEIKSELAGRVLQLEQDEIFSMWLVEKMEEQEVTMNPDALASIDFSALYEM